MSELTKNNILFGILFISFLTPFIFFMMGLPMILQTKGFDASLIGLFQIVAIPTVFKFLLSPPIDKMIFKQNHYKKWTYAIALVYVCLLFAISYLSLEDNIYLVFIAILITTFIATFIDIPLNALAIKVFHKNQRVALGSYKSGSYFISGLFGGGIFLLVYNHLGWQNTFIIMAIMVLISLLALKFIEEKDEYIEQPQVSFKILVSFFQQPKIGIWIFILSFYFAFISTIWIFMKPYLIEKGISPDDVAWYVGIYGSIIGAVGSLFINIVSKKFSKKALLLLFMAFNIISVLTLAISELLGFEVESYLFVSVTLTALAIALSSAIIFALIMDYSRNTSRAIDYSLQASLFSFTRIISAVIASIFVSHFGFGGMFIFEFICLIIVTLIIYENYKND